MGYSTAWRENVLRSALRGYLKYCHGVVNRTGASTFKSRRVKRLTGKRTWFDKKNENREDPKPGGRTKHKRPQNTRREGPSPVTGTVVFVPHTPGGVLKQRLNRMEDSMVLNGRVKFVEELGSSLSQLLCSPDPWQEECGCSRCFPCRSKPGRCHSQGVVYTIVCMTCKGEGRKTQYF